MGKNTKINLIASTDSSYIINIDVAGISNGPHKLYIRTKDVTGRCSFPVQRSIEVTASFDIPAIIAGEYFFDLDPGYRKANAITVLPSDTDAVASLMAAVAALNSGYHKLYLRFRDNKGNWSITTQRNVEIIKTADTIKIVEAEYFFAADDGFGKEAGRVFANPLEQGDFKFKIPYNSIPPDADTLFIPRKRQPE